MWFATTVELNAALSCSVKLKSSCTYLDLKTSMNLFTMGSTVFLSTRGLGFDHGCFQVRLNRSVLCFRNNKLLMRKKKVTHCKRSDPYYVFFGNSDVLCSGRES